MSTAAWCAASKASCDRPLGGQPTQEPMTTRDKVKMTSEKAPYVAGVWGGGWRPVATKAVELNHVR